MDYISAKETAAKQEGYETIHCKDVSTAISAIQTGQLIDIALEPLRILLDVKNQSVEIAGLFKRFEGSRSDKGYGVGLPPALAILRGQNGDIEVSGGEYGSGATFTLKFFK